MSDWEGQEGLSGALERRTAACFAEGLGRPVRDQKTKRGGCQEAFQGARKKGGLSEKLALGMPREPGRRGRERFIRGAVWVRVRKAYQGLWIEAM